MKRFFSTHTSKFWLALAIGSLLLAGILATLLVVARMPPFSGWITDPLFFKRALVVHVDLSLFVWFLAFLRFLLVKALPNPRLALWERFSVSLAILGVLMWVISPFLPQAQPILCNYLPVIDHPVFLTGLVLFVLGLALGILGRELFPTHAETFLSEACLPGLRVAGLAVILAIVTTWSTLLSTPRNLEPMAFYEILFWGGGHVLQFANTAAMLALWLFLVEQISGQPVLKRGTANLLFGLMILPCLVAPLIPLQDPTSGFYRLFFTRLMQWGIFPVTLMILARCLFVLMRSKQVQWRSLAAFGWLCSVGLTLTGFVLGALIRGSNTLVPAHYHANIGAVTVTYMTVGLMLLWQANWSVRKQNWARFQPLIFGLGQTVFALGFALAGAHGMSRKVYGAEQHIRTTAEYVGLTVMGLGGLLAIIGGILFLGLTLRPMWQQFRPQPISKTNLGSSHLIEEEI